MTSRTIGSSSTTRTVVMLLFWPPLRVMARRPVLVDCSERDPAERVARRRVDDREVEVPDEQHERRVHQAVVKKDGAREAETRVSLAEPQQHAGAEEEQHER